MILPGWGDDPIEHVIQSPAGATVTFRLRLVPGDLWQAITEALIDRNKADGRSEADAVLDDQYRIDVLTAGIGHVYSSTDSTLIQFAPDVTVLTQTYKPELGDRNWPMIEHDGQVRTATAAAEELWQGWPPYARAELFTAVRNLNLAGAADPKAE